MRDAWYHDSAPRVNSVLPGANRGSGVHLVEDGFRTLREWGATLLRYQMVRRGLKPGEERPPPPSDNPRKGALLEGLGR